jgi:hypothetical protein
MPTTHMSMITWTKNKLSRLDANRCKAIIKLIIDLLDSNNKIKIVLQYYVIDFRF